MSSVFLCWTVSERCSDNYWIGRPAERVCWLLIQLANKSERYVEKEKVASFAAEHRTSSRIPPVDSAAAQWTPV